MGKPYVQKIDDEKFSAVGRIAPIHHAERAGPDRQIRKTRQRACSPTCRPVCGKTESVSTLFCWWAWIDRTFLTSAARVVQHTIAAHCGVSGRRIATSRCRITTVWTERHRSTLSRIQQVSPQATQFLGRNGNDKPQSCATLRPSMRLVREIGDSECADMNRIYVVGHSLGAQFCQLSCSRRVRRPQQSVAQCIW